MGVTKYIYLFLLVFFLGCGGDPVKEAANYSEYKKAYWERNGKYRICSELGALVVGRCYWFWFFGESLLTEEDFLAEKKGK